MLMPLYKCANFLCSGYKKAGAAFFRSDPSALFRICFTWKSRRNLRTLWNIRPPPVSILRRYTTNFNSFAQRWQKRTNFCKKAKVRNTFFIKAPNLCFGIGEYLLCGLVYAEDDCCRALRPPPLMLYYPYSEKISMSFGKESNFGNKNSKFGHTFYRAAVYNLFHAANLIKNIRNIL